MTRLQSPPCASPQSELSRSTGHSEKGHQEGVEAGWWPPEPPNGPSAPSLRLSDGPLPVPPARTTAYTQRDASRPGRSVFREAPIGPLQLPVLSCPVCPEPVSSQPCGMTEHHQPAGVNVVQNLAATFSPTAFSARLQVTYWLCRRDIASLLRPPEGREVG